MKYLNTKYPSLFDSSRFCTINSQYGIITSSDTFNPYGTPAYCTKNISGTTSIYVQFLCHSTGGINGAVVNIQTAGGNNLLVQASSTQLRFTDTNATFTETIDVPSSQSEIGGSYHKRVLHVHFDTVQNLAEIYSDGIYYGDVTCDNNGENISSILIGNVNASSSIQYRVQFGNIIISDTTFLPNESITEVTPTITSTDWTVASGTATTDVVGGAMVLTAPSGSIDETKRSVTGYGIAFFDASSSATINALNVAQGGVTQQVLLPSSGDIETANAFTVSQLSGISATVTSAYVSS